MHRNPTFEGLRLLDIKPIQVFLVKVDSQYPSGSHGLSGDEAYKFLTYQLPTVGYWPTVALTGNGELGFDSGEGA